MRAAANKESALACNRQSQRVTRRSFEGGAFEAEAFEAADTVFHPVPEHRGHTSAAALITDTRPMLETIPVPLTLHCCGRFAQVLKPSRLCTSCEPVVRSVEDGGKMEYSFTSEPAVVASSRKPCSKPQFGPDRCKTGFRRGFSQLTFSPEGAQYQRSGFPTQPHLFLPGLWAGYERDLRGETHEQSRSR